MMKIQIIIAFTLLTTASTYSVSPRRSTRRDVFNQLGVGLFGLVSTASGANALESCPPKSNNCVRTVWTPPEGTSKDDSIKGLLEAINAYPQEGQQQVDEGGWSIVEDNFSTSGTGRIEYKSSGKGPFAKLFNGGKPFTDDVRIEVESNGTAQLKSNSRVGDSDMGVNTKRVEYLSNLLTSKGWASTVVYKPK